MSDPEFFLKRVSGTYNGLYKHPRALYTNLTQSFIYVETMCNIRETVRKKEENIYACINRYAKRNRYGLSFCPS